MRTILYYCQQTAVPELSLFTVTVIFTISFTNPTHPQLISKRHKGISFTTNGFQVFCQDWRGGGRFEAAALSHPYIYWEPGKTLYGGIECKWFNELHSYPHNTTCTQRYEYISYMNMYKYFVYLFICISF